MTTNETIIQPARVVTASDQVPTPQDTPVVVVEEGVPVALNGAKPALVIQFDDAAQDMPRLLRAAETLLPIYRQAPGVVLVDAEGAVRGMIPRADLETAVLAAQAGDYAAVGRSIGLRGDYAPPAGDAAFPFICWRCPECGHVWVPPEGRGDETPFCHRHTPPVPMVRSIHSGG